MAEPGKRFPAEFADLEPLGEWAVPTEIERIRRRMEASDQELRAFYDALMPRMDDVVRYLNGFPLGGMPEDTARLFALAKSLMEIANVVEHGKSKVAWRFDVSRFVPMQGERA